MINLRQRLTHYLLSLVLISLLLSTTSYADDSSNQRLTISSDEVTMHYRQGYSDYKGHVIAHRGASQLTGQRLQTFRNQHGQVYKILVDGQPSQLYTANASKQAQPLHAHAQRMLLAPLNHYILLLGQAHAQQGQTIINAPLIGYNTQKAVLKAYHQGHHSVTISSQHDLSQGS